MSSPGCSPSSPLPCRTTSSRRQGCATPSPIPARYPNGHDEGAPFRHYGKLQSEEAQRSDRRFERMLRSDTVSVFGT